MPEYLADICKQDYKCIRFYQAYGFFLWVGGSVISSYFTYALREYKNRMFAKLDSIEESRIDAKI